MSVMLDKHDIVLFFYSMHFGSGWSRVWQALQSVTQMQRVQKR